jgi:hypothetical protein
MVGWFLKPAFSFPKIQVEMSQEKPTENSFDNFDL